MALTSEFLADESSNPFFLLEIEFSVVFLLLLSIFWCTCGEVLRECVVLVRQKKCPDNNHIHKCEEQYIGSKLKSRSKLRARATCVPKRRNCMAFVYDIRGHKFHNCLSLSYRLILEGQAARERPQIGMA